MKRNKTIKILFSSFILLSSGMTGLFYFHQNASARRMIKPAKTSIIQGRGTRQASVATGVVQGTISVSEKPVAPDFCSAPDKQNICSEAPSIVNLDGAIYPGLKKFQSYQDICQSKPFSGEMVFVAFPDSEAEADSSALEVSKILQEFSKFNIEPVIVFEPTSSAGNISFKDIAGGKYDSILDYYFAKIGGIGIDSQNIGTWIPYPEANTPAFAQTSFVPSDFPKMINGFSNSFRKKFPSGKIGILLDSESYDQIDYNWANGRYASLAPYLTGIAKNNVDIFYLQGFPWSPKKTETDISNSLNANEFLPVGIISEAANILGTKKIALHTGTFGKKYRLSSETVIMTSTERKKILEDTLTIAENLKLQDYQPTISLFAENKFNAGEETDWSYLGSSADESMLKEFLRKAGCLGVNLALYDY